MELANTCNEGDKSGAKCFVQLQVRCELTQDVKWRERGKKEGGQHKERRGHFRLHCCLKLVEVSYAGRLQGAGRQRGSRPMGMSDCNHHGKMEGNTTLCRTFTKFLPEHSSYLLHSLSFTPFMYWSKDGIDQ